MSRRLSSTVFQKGQGRFQRGVSGNPSGKSKVYGEVQKLARSYSVEAIEKLAAIMRGRSPKLSLKAAELILDRAWGRAPQAITGEGGDGPVKISVSWQSADMATIDLKPQEPPPLLEVQEVPEDGDQN